MGDAANHETHDHLLKPTNPRAVQFEQDLENRSKTKKTHELSLEEGSQEAPEKEEEKAEENFVLGAPAVRGHSSRARTASPRPHARTNRNRNRNRFPGSGGRTSRTSSP